MAEAVDSPDFRLAIAALLKSAEDVRASVVIKDPTDDSTAHHDLGAAQRTLGSAEAVERMLRLVDIWTLVEAEQLRGMGVLLEDGSTVLTLFPLMRSVIEHASAVCWLLDPDLDVRSRATRAALSTLRSDTELVAVVKRWAGKSSEAYAEVKGRLEQTRASIVRDFDDVDLGSSTIGATKLPSPTEVVVHFGRCDRYPRRWEGTYGFLCGTATHPSLNAFELIEVTDDLRTELVLSTDFANRLTRMSLRAYVHSLRHLVSYTGGPRSPIDTFEQRASLVLGNTPKEA